MRSDRTRTLTAISLRQWPSGEHDRIVAFLTKDDGRKVAKARGTRRPGSKLAAILTPPSYLDVTLYETKTMPVVTGAQVLGGFVHLQDELVRLASAQVLLEICDRAIPELGLADGAFALVLAALRSLDAGQPPLTVLLRSEVGLMQSLGWGFSLTHCSACGKPLTPLSFVGREQDGLTCKSCGGMRQVPETVQRALAGQTGSIAGVREAHAVLDLLWRRHLDWALKSPAFLFQVLGEGS